MMPSVGRFSRPGMVSQGVTFAHSAQSRHARSGCAPQKKHAPQPLFFSVLLRVPARPEEVTIMHRSRGPNSTGLTP
jgi:hypothetical protein